MQSLESIFKAQPKSVYDIICNDEKVGFYLPAYQRPYSWTERNIKDLFSDLENVYRNLFESDDAIIFLGSILTVDDDGSSLYPKVDKQHPSQIKLIIDGQQRLSTLILLITCLNEKLNLLLPILQKEVESDDLEDTLRNSLEQLEEMTLELIDDSCKFMVETAARNKLYKYQPKIIRSQIDCWGKDSASAKYTSPIAEYLIGYQEHLIEQKEAKGYKKFDLKKLTSAESLIVQGNLKEIRKQLERVENGFFDAIADKNEEQSDFQVSLNSLISENFENCLDFKVDENLIEYAKSNQAISKVLFIVSFCKFVLRRVCLTYVEVNSESYAFDMFEALNTTGEPLTALETFVPKVIEHIQGKEPEESKLAYKTLNSITRRFEKFKKPVDKNKFTKALILMFVRAYKGDAKVTHLRDQRDAFLKSYSECNVQMRDEYLDFLTVGNDFLFDRWSPELSNMKGITYIDAHGLVNEDDNEIATVCLSYLKDIKHDITLSVLLQFILRDCKYRSETADPYEFFEALKAIVAFSVLWRSMSGGADGIDSVYKKLHLKAFEVNNEKFNPFQLKNGLVDIKIDVLKGFFREQLSLKIEDKEGLGNDDIEKWLSTCLSQNHLDKPQSQKMLILSAFHNMEFSEGSFRKNDAKRNDFLNPSMWDKLSEKDAITTVYSKNEDLSGGWSDELKSINVNLKLGNVLIDPSKNLKSQTLLTWSDLANRMKQELKNDAIEQIDNLVDASVSEVGKTNIAALKLKCKYKEIIFAQEWNKEAVESRTKALLMNAWINLHKWIE